MVFKSRCLSLPSVPTGVGLLLLLGGRFQEESGRRREVLEAPHGSRLIGTGGVRYGRGPTNRGRRLVGLHRSSTEQRASDGSARVNRCSNAKSVNIQVSTRFKNEVSKLILN